VQFNGRESIMKPLRPGWALLAGALLAACSDGSDNSGDTSACGAFRTTLSVKDRMSQSANVFNPNEPITFDLAITNTRNAPETLTAGSSCTAVVFEIADSAQRRRWGSADNIACIQMLQPRTYSPLETVTESATWDQRDSGGATASPGTYTVTAAVGQYVSNTQGMVDCRAALSKSATFTIR
jgi:hypothetical protein